MLIWTKEENENLIFSNIAQMYTYDTCILYIGQQMYHIANKLDETRIFFQRIVFHFETMETIDYKTISGYFQFKLRKEKGR